MVRLLVFGVALCVGVVWAQPAPEDIESSIGRGVPAVVGMTGEAFLVRIEQQRVVDRGIDWFDVITPHGRLLISGDPDLPFVQRLHAVKGGRARITIEAAEPERLTR